MLKTTLQEDGSGPGTVVGVNVALSGTLKDQNDIVVHGMVDGEVISDKTVSIGQSAQIKGPVKAIVVTVAGVVRGEVTASDRVEVMESGKVFGTITTKDLIVRSGAIISGKIEMATEPEPVSTEEPAADGGFKETPLENGEEKENDTLTPDED